MEIIGVGRRRRTKLLDNFRNRRRYWKLKEEGEDKKKNGNDSLSHEHKEEIRSYLPQVHGSANKLEA